MPIARHLLTLVSLLHRNIVSMHWSAYNLTPAQQSNFTGSYITTYMPEWCHCCHCCMNLKAITDFEVKRYVIHYLLLTNSLSNVPPFVGHRSRHHNHNHCYWRNKQWTDMGQAVTAQAAGIGHEQYESWIVVRFPTGARWLLFCNAFRKPLVGKGHSHS